jgi:hypothetical protein
VAKKTLNIIRYREDLASQWDRFVWKSNNGTLFHTRQFLNYHPKDRFEDNSLIFMEKDRILALFPAAVRNMMSKKILSSHCGSSYGGFVTNESLSIQAAFDLVNALLVYAEKEAFNSVEMTPPPIIYMSRPSQYIDFALYKNSYVYKKREVSSIIPLDFPIENILNYFKPEARTAFRKSVKSGVIIKESDDFPAFYKILQKNLALRHNVTPTHTLDELGQLKMIFPERIHLIGAFLEDQMIAGVTNFNCNDRVVLAFYISHDVEFQAYRPVNYLFYQIIRDSIKKGYHFLDYGIFTVNEDPNLGLAKFKESFGARGVFRDTYIKEL